jgi:hypothetical protein
VFFEACVFYGLTVFLKFDWSAFSPWEFYPLHDGFTYGIFKYPMIN